MIWITPRNYTIFILNLYDSSFVKIHFVQIFPRLMWHKSLNLLSFFSAMMILWLLPWHLFTSRLIGYSWWNVFKDVAPFTLAAAITMAITYYTTRTITNIYLLLIVRCVIATLIYYAVMKLCKVQILAECEQFFLKKIKK